MIFSRLLLTRLIASPTIILCNYSSSKLLTVAEAASFKISLANSLSEEIVAISKWGEKNLVDFNAEKYRFCILTNKRSKLVAKNSTPGKTLNRFFQILTSVGVTITKNLKWLAKAWLSISSSTFSHQKISLLSTGLKHNPQLSIALTYEVLLVRRLSGCYPEILDSPYWQQELTDSHRREVCDISPFYRHFIGDFSKKLLISASL